jgi:AAA domain/Bifunctional DNA primase/polymerase, N-terminal
MVPFEVRCLLRQQGYSPLPAARNKAVYLDGWQTLKKTTPEDFKRWEREHPEWDNSSILTFNTPTFDNDIYDPEAAEAVSEKVLAWIDEHNGVPRIRIGRAPKRAFFFRTDVPFNKIEQYFVDPAGRRHDLEFLCDGQQVVVAGIHPDTKKPYGSHGPSLHATPWSDLTPITKREAAELFGACCDLLVKQFGFTKTDKLGNPQPNGQASAKIDIDADVEMLLASMTRGNFNATIRHVVPRLIWKAWHPKEIVDYVTEHSALRAQELGLPWKDKIEKQHRIMTCVVKSTLKNLFTNKYDHTSGDIPRWLADAFHADWVRVLTLGQRPELRYDNGTWAVFSISGTAGGAAKPADKKLAIPLTAQEWMERELPPSDPLLGSWLTTTSRVLLSADTGLGKTNLCMALAGHIAAGLDFLHWRVLRPARVLYIDGEMSRALLKERIADLARRLGCVPEGLHFFSREDCENFEPLNTPAGMVFLHSLLDQISGVEFGFFDNCMALISGKQAEEDSWTKTLPLVSSLTKRHVGQLWVNHTGHDATRSYGTKTREWRMDTTVHLTALERSDCDISFALEFRKARERTPANRADFADVNIALVDDKWVGSGESTQRHGKPSGQEASVLAALSGLLVGSNVTTFRGHIAVHTELWQADCLRRGLVVSASSFRNVRSRLAQKNLIECDGDLTWKT